MLPQVLPKNKFSEFAGFLKTGRRLVAPVAKGPQFSFREIETPQDVQDIRLDYDITILPPKKFMVPQHEALMSFSSRDPSTATAEVAAVPTVILGAHPYDLHAIATLDAAYSGEPADPYYAARRKATKLIGVNIRRPANDFQFQADMGTLEPPEGGFALFLTDLGDRYFVEVGGKDGEEMVAASKLFSAATADDFKAKHSYDAEKAHNFPRKLPYSIKYLPELLDASYDSLLWDAVSRRCFSCGTCTNVCPTCYCFDVQDKLNIDVVSGVRERKWDSCQLKVFAEVAGGENFREHKQSRLRHRMFRKGKYILARTGRIGCVGCGRCIHHCVANISILEAFQQIANEAEIEA